MVSAQATDDIYMSLCDECRPSIGLRDLYNKRQLSSQETKEESEYIQADNAEEQEESIRFELRPSYKQTKGGTNRDSAHEESILLLLNPHSHNEIYLASSFNRKLTSICERCSEENEALKKLQMSEKHGSNRSLLKKVLSNKALKKK